MARRSARTGRSDFCSRGENHEPPRRAPSATTSPATSGTRSSSVPARRARWPRISSPAAACERCSSMPNHFHDQRCAAAASTGAQFPRSRPPSCRTSSPLARRCRWTNFKSPCAGRRTRFPLPEGASICRSEFDARLALAAVAAGATFAYGITAIVDPDPSDECRLVSASCGSRHVDLRTRIVVCADGLTRSSLRRLAGFEAVVAPARTSAWAPSCQRNLSCAAIVESRWSSPITATSAWRSSPATA